MLLSTKYRLCFLLCTVFLVSAQNIFAQGSDFLLLKKGDRTLRHYLAGQHIEFTSSTGAYHNALITNIKNDSVFLQEFLIQRIPTTYGGFIIDTAGSFRFVYNYRDILYLGRIERKNFNVAGSGGALLGGGTLLTLASAVVWVVDRESFSPVLMASGAGLAGLGYLMSRAGSKPITIGKKKYRLEYLNMQTEN